MRAFRVVVNQPVIQVLLECLHTFEEVLAEDNAEILVQYSFVEAFNEAAGFQGFSFRSTMFNIVQGKVKLERMVLRPAELAAIVGENCAHGQVMFPVERQHIIVHQCGGTFRFLAGVQGAKSVRTIGIHAGMQIHLPDAFETACKQGVLA